jgi:hypothetical protein
VRPPKDVSGARVILARESGDADTLLEESPWRVVQRLLVGLRAGQHEGLGGIAIAAAAGLLGEGEATEILVIGLSKDRGYALTLALP